MRNSKEIRIFSSKKGTFRAPFRAAFQHLQKVKIQLIYYCNFFSDVPPEFKKIFIAKIGYIKCLKSLHPMFR